MEPSVNTAVSNQVEVSQPSSKSLTNPINKGREYLDQYDWKRGRAFQISRREMLIAEAFLETRNYRECARRVGKDFGGKVSDMTCRRWLEKSWVKEWLRGKMEERGLMAGWDKGHWMRVMSDHMVGEKKLSGADVYVMKLIGQAQGFFEVGENVVNLNTQINFTQMDGNP